MEYDIALTAHSYELAKAALRYLASVEDSAWAAGAAARQDAHAFLEWQVCTLYEPDCGPAPQPRLPPPP